MGCPALRSEMELRIVERTGYIQIPPKLGSIHSDRLDACHLDWLILLGSDFVNSICWTVACARVVDCAPVYSEVCLLYHVTRHVASTYGRSMTNGANY
jgi:hypothetical protein